MARVRAHQTRQHIVCRSEEAKKNHSPKWPTNRLLESKHHTHKTARTTARTTGMSFSGSVTNQKEGEDEEEEEEGGKPQEQCNIQYWKISVS